MKRINPFGEYLRVGQVKKNFGLGGEIIISLNSEIEPVSNIVVDVNASLIPFRIEKCTMHDLDMRVKLKLINSPKEIEFILLKAVFVAKEYVKQYEFFNSDISEYKVFDKRYGPLGYVASTKKIFQQNMLCLDYNNSELLIPIHPNLMKIDDTKKIIYTELPLDFIEQ